MQATGPYTFSGQPTTGSDLITTQRVAQADDTAAQVIGSDSSSVTVELTEQTSNVPEGAQTESSG